MSMGEAKRLHKATRLPILIVNAHGVPVASELFQGVPYILRQRGRHPYQKIINAPGVRPYIAAKTGLRWVWKPYTPIPAEIVFTASELAFAEQYRGMVLLEPNVKNIGHRNKDWGWANWLALDHLMGSQPRIQCFRPGDSILPGVTGVLTPTFRQTAAVLSVCKAFVGPEGGLHHAAAATGVPAVVLYGGFVAPNITGYKQHRNLFTGGKACGSRMDCRHCRDAMNKITPAMVLGELQEILR